MELSLKDRLILANQCRILEKLYPEEAAAYARYRVAFERGYQYHYDDLPGFFTNEMRSDQSQELIEMLDMHRALTFAYEKLEDKSGIAQKDIAFRGFDGNNETEYLAYARYICLDHGEERWHELHDGLVNSHSPMLGIYRRMLDEWNRAADKYNLTKEEILRIISARAFPK